MFNIAEDQFPHLVLFQYKSKKRPIDVLSEPDDVDFEFMQEGQREDQQGHESENGCECMPGAQVGGDEDSEEIEWQKAQAVHRSTKHVILISHHSNGT